MDNAKIGALIAAVRKEQGLTQKELGQRLHVSDRAVSKWERGLNLPDAALFEPLCRELGITVTELLRGEREEATIPELEQVVSDTLSLAEYKEQLARRNKALAQGLLALLILCGVLGFCITGGPFILLWGAADRWDDAVEQFHNSSVPVMPEVQLYHSNTGQYHAYSYVQLRAGGGQGAQFSAHDGELYEGERELWAAYQPTSVESRSLYRLEITSHDTVYFRLEGGRDRDGLFDVEVYRCPADRLGEPLTLEDCWRVFWDEARAPTSRGEKRFPDAMSFPISPNYYYTIVIRWGDEVFAEYPFLTT